MTQSLEDSSDRVVVLTPTGRDGSMVCERLSREGIACLACEDFEQFAASLQEQAGAAVVAQEALVPENARRLLALLEAQEPWSDVPVLLLASPASRKRGRGYSALGLFEQANVTVLQRPMTPRLFLSAVRSALRARRRQYRMRDLHRELERAVQLSDMFVSILGHDLRTPLTAIKMSAETILRGSHEPIALRPAGRVLGSADRMARMIEQILDFARVRQGRGIPLHLKPANLADIWQQVVQEIEDAFPDVSVQLDKTGHLEGGWDPDRLAQVFTNLLGNAAQHGDKSQPITVALDGTDPGVVRARVQNAGAIPAQALPTLFEAFKRATAGASARRGLGLGLFIARETARAHGGEVSVEVTEWATTFEVTLPREARPADTQALTR